MIDPKYHQAVQTTGYTWDGDIQEFNNVIPKIWLVGFLSTIIFAIIYWVLYPAWPTLNDYTKGTFNRISYQFQGEVIRTHWNSRAYLLNKLQNK